MDSPDVERSYSLDPSAQYNVKGAPNPNRDYKRHFQRQKERYTALTADQTSRKKELSRASLKQIKLQEEVEFLIDAIAGERHRRQQIRAGEPLSPPLAHQEASRHERTRRIARDEVNDSVDDPVAALLDEQEEQDVKPAVAGTSSRSQRKNSVDQDLEDLLGDDDDDKEGEDRRRSHVQPERASSRRSIPTKRLRPPSNDTDDELLEAAGLSAAASTKRARNG